MGFFEGMWGAVNHTITRTHSAISLTSVALVPRIQPRGSGSHSFLDLPVEIRLMIYELSLSDMYSEGKFDNDLCYSRRTTARREGFDIYFNVLLVNKQLNCEARTLFYRHHLHQLRQSHQTYYVCQVSKPASSTPDASGPAQSRLTFPSSNWTWRLGVHSLWTCNCSSTKALAGLQLPKIGLAFWHPQHHRPSKATERQSTEQLTALKTFAEELVANLEENKMKTSITIHIDKKARRCPAQAIFHALAPLRDSYANIDISFTNHGATDLDNWMTTELMRTTGSQWSVVSSDSRRAWCVSRSIARRLRERNIRDEIIKDHCLREARGFRSLGSL